jgi:hypothetical protein
MKIISKPAKIDATITRLLKKYKRYHIATAWASLGSNSQPFQGDLLAAKITLNVDI